MYISQNHYCRNDEKYSFQEIEDRLNALSHLDKAQSWVYPDLTTRPISTIAKIIRCIRAPLSWLVRQFGVFPYYHPLNRLARHLNSLPKTVDKCNGIDIKKSKKFLKDIKKFSRSHFNFHLNTLADRAIHQFNLSFPKHQVKHKIQMPLLDTEDKEYEFHLFQDQLSPEATYLGANLVELNEGCRMPRTLYHLFFIYFALKGGNTAKQYPILGSAFPMNDKEGMFLEQDKIADSQTTDRLHPEILNFLKERNLAINQLTWKDVKVLVDDMCKEFKPIHDTLTPNMPYRPRDHSDLFCIFYQYCFNFKDSGAKFKETTLQALALEWASPSGTEIFYRGAQISDEDIVNKEKNKVHSLSFSSSLFAGLVFEGGPNGTCSYVYYNIKYNRQLYALPLSASKLEKYFFYPAIFKKYSLLPLTAKGEFSHPRLKFFMADDTTKISGVSYEYNEAKAKEIASYKPDLKVTDLTAYRQKIKKLYQKHIQLLGV